MNSRVAPPNQIVVLLGIIILSTIGCLSIPGLFGARTPEPGQPDGPASVADVLIDSSVAYLSPTAEDTPTASATFTALPPTATSTPRPSATATQVAVLEAYSTPATTPVAFIDAPVGPQPQPFVILTAFIPGQGSAGVRIKGRINYNWFSCTSSPCILPVVDDAIILFEAYTASGEYSDTIQAIVRVDQEGTQYLVTIEAQSQIFVFLDSCSEIWERDSGLPPEWARLPQSPSQLSTKKTLHYLAGELIRSGAVDASDCPAGGLSAEGANGCGLERASTALIEWQNQYDYNIWTVGQEIGIPPRLLKMVFEFESQYWPGSARYFIEEYGLGQVNDLGIDVALRWDRALYLNVCRASFADCSEPYTRLTESQRALLRGVVLRALNSDCPTCSYGVDLEKTQRSVQTIALLLRANCADTNHIIVKNEASQNLIPTSYEDYWKFTMVAYHSGYDCLETGIKNIALYNEPLDWAHLSLRLTCPGAKEYVDQLWQLLETFENYRLYPGEVALSNQVMPTFSPTRTIEPPPTPILSRAQVRVRVFVDSSGDNEFDPSEGLDGVLVQLLVADGSVLSGTTLNGEVTFDMSGYPIGISVTATLPGLYRSYSFPLPEDGEVLLDFGFSQPVIPTQIP